MTPLFSQAPAGSSPGPAPARQSNSISSWNVVETGADRRVSRLAASPLGVIPPSPKGPRSYTRKAPLLRARQVGNPDCPVYGTIPRGEQQTVPYVGQSPCRRAEELCSESIPPLRRTGRESGLSRIWDDPPGRATNCPICGTIPLPKGRGVMLGKHPPSTPDRSGIRIVPYMGRSPPAGEPRTVPYVGQSPLPKGRGVMLGKHPPSTPDRSGIRIVPYMGRSPGESNKLSHMWDNPLAEGPECSIWGDNLHRREIGAFRSPDAVLQHIAIYFTPKGETHDGLLPASSTHGS
jgi:hypothetical protein